ncbi:MAG: hypothetical protein KAG56_07645 [Sulfurovaceae bacterium]|nr:hypothetical protein [Sulfurovaceae bacterium]
MFKQILLLVMVFWLTACVQPPVHGTPSATVSVGSQNNGSMPMVVKKVGYLINVGVNPLHTHIGTTTLTNFEKRYGVNWQIPAYIQNRLQSEFNTLRNVKLVNLATYGIKAGEVNGLLVYTNGRWRVRKTQERTYAQLISRLGLSTIIIINESEKQAINDCGMMGCKKFKAKGYGLLTQSFMSTDKFYSATAFFVHIYNLKPIISLDPKIAEINHSEKMTMVAISKNSQAEPNKIGFVYPKNFKNWTQREFAPFRLPLIKYIDGMSRKIVDIVRSN